MSLQYFQRNKGVPLVIKLALLIIACYLVFQLLRLLAVVLAAVLVVFKYVVLVALFALLGSVLLKFLFGINLFPFKSNFHSSYYRK